MKLGHKKKNGQYGFVLTVLVDHMGRDRNGSPLEKPGHFDNSPNYFRGDIGGHFGGDFGGDQLPRWLPW